MVVRVSRIKVYADVDGTLTTGIFNHHQTVVVEAHGQALTLRWRQETIESIAAISKHPSIEFWWLTAWQGEAVRVLDPLWGIGSAGVIDWAEPYGDWMHTSKRAAVLEDQELDATPFICIDDLAMQKLEEDSPLRRPDSLLLAVNELVGLTLSDISAIHEFVERFEP